MTYPIEPGSTKGIETTIVAARAVASKADGQKEFLHDALQTLGMIGLTLDEAIDHMKRAGFDNIIRNNVSARLASLCADGRAIRVPETRKSTYPGAKPQSIYKAKYYELYQVQPIESVRAKKKGFCDEWRIWSMIERAWRTHDLAGFSPEIAFAGVYTFKDAAEICERAGFDEIGIPNETMLPIMEKKFL